MNVEEFIKVAESTKLTKPQQYIIDRLKTGDRLILVNQHWACGGQIMWFHNGREDYAGHIYKALQHLRWRTKVEGNIDGLWVKKN